MFYDFSVTIPTTATKGDPFEQELQLPFGIVHKVTLFWWPGPHGLVHLVINRYGHQVLPTNPGESFHYDNLTHVMEDRIELLTPPHTLTVVGWGVNCSYDHEVIIGVGILPPESFPEYQPADTRLAKMLKLVGIK